jgi:hypothetical protein
VIITVKQKFKPKRIMLVWRRQATGFIGSALTCLVAAPYTEV